MSKYGGPLHQFEIVPLIPLEIAGMDISFTNASLFMLLAAAAIILLIGMPLGKRSLVPGRLQNIGEILYEFVTDTVRENVGEEGLRYFPLVFSLFIFVLTCNILGMMPYSFTVTSHIAVTFALAMVVFMTMVIVGLLRHGLHFFSLFLPSGTPLWLAPLMIVIELFSFLSRPLTLAVRLAGNMLAGHILLKVLASFVIGMGVMWGWVPIPFIMLFTGFEIFVAVLQAYIFTVLTCAYLRDAVHLH